MIPIFVINLPPSKERRENISNQLHAAELEFQIFEAINGRKEPHPLFKRYDDEAARRYLSRSLTPAQLGCYASHYLLWEKCIKMNTPIIVLEDDAKIDSTLLKDFIKNSHMLDEKFGCIRLFQCMYRNYKKTLVKNIGLADLYYFSKGHMRATGYYINPQAAERLLFNSKSWFLPVDIYMDRYWLHSVLCYGTVPPCVNNDEKFDSDIGYQAREKRTLRQNLRREFLRGLEKIKKLYFDLLNRPF